MQSVFSPNNPRVHNNVGNSSPRGTPFSKVSRSCTTFSERSMKTSLPLSLPVLLRPMASVSHRSVCLRLFPRTWRRRYEVQSLPNDPLALGRLILLNAANIGSVGSIRQHGYCLTSDPVLVLQGMSRGRGFTRVHVSQSKERLKSSIWCFCDDAAPT